MALRQRDPLSLLLFIVIMESLSRILAAAVGCGLLSSFLLSYGSPNGCKFDTSLMWMVI